METDLVFLTAEVYSFIGILLSAIIFTRLMFKARSIGAFRFQLSIFILIWVAAEIPHVLDSIGLIDAGNYLELGLLLHLVSMIVFAVFVGIRSLRYLYPPTPPGKELFQSPSLPSSLGRSTSPSPEEGLER